MNQENKMGVHLPFFLRKALHLPYQSTILQKYTAKQ